MQKPGIYIFDIDGTIADSYWRADKYLSQSPKDWANFKVRSIDDSPILETSNILSSLSVWHDIALVTGRDVEDAGITEAWLDKNDILHCCTAGIYYRPSGDRREDWIVKKEVYLKHIEPNFRVLGVFEDRKQCVQMWRDLGLRCYAVCEGDY